MATFSKKHYNKLANEIKEFRKNDAQLAQAMASLLAQWFAEDNPNFSRERFMEACNV